uniref:Guided entry of tail-anchored proteins factor 1 n=1 Tax=Steinernema glaseri TaxID=37863 RepID=A0A1I7YRN6_9BILA
MVRDCASLDDFYRVCVCVTAVLVLAFGYDVFQKILRLICSLVLPETQAQKRSREIKAEMDVLKMEMAELSPRDDFAKYFKRDRMLNKLRDQLAEISSTEVKENVLRSAFITAVARVLTASIGISSMWWTSDVKFYRFSSPDTCWPLCNVMDMPEGLGRMFGYRESSDTDAYISLFVFLNLLTRVCRRLPKLIQGVRTPIPVAEKSKSQ